MDAARFDSLKVAVLTAGLALVPALALGPAALAEKEARVSDVECGILLPGILPEGKVLSTTGLLTIESSGAATLVCHAQLDPALAPAEAVVLREVDCALGEGGQVAESRIVVRPNGGVTLTCHNNPGSEPFLPGED
jgi:hypothetical protein